MKIFFQKRGNEVGVYPRYHASTLTNKKTLPGYVVGRRIGETLQFIDGTEQLVEFVFRFKSKFLLVG